MDLNPFYRSNKPGLNTTRISGTFAVTLTFPDMLIPKDLTLAWQL